jgi:hypothetical protein
MNAITKPAGESILAQLRGINYKILNFAQRPENLALLPKTRSYSTPFRGTYGGEFLQHKVAERLENWPVEVLVMGSNPNDVGDTPAATKYRSLEEQIASGFYGEAYWEAGGRPVPGWSPFNDWKPGWQLLTNTIQSMGSDCVTMANYLPWGSRDLQDLATKTEPGLLDRVVRFSDELFEDVLQVLRPKVVIVPKSLTGDALAGRSLLSAQRREAKQISVPYSVTGGSRRLVLEIGALRVRGLETRLVHLAHPSSWRVPVHSREAVKRGLARVLR